MSIFEQILSLPFFLRQRRLAKSRTPMAESAFFTRIEAAGGDLEAARFVHRHLQEWIIAEGFTPYPDDNLGNIYGTREEELDEDLILGVLAELHLQPPGREAVNAFGAVRTPIDVARFVSFARTPT